MKNILIIFLLTFVSFSVAGQTWSEHRAQKKAERAEERMIEKARPMDLAKVGKHLKNAGWSILGGALVIPYAVVTGLERREFQQSLQMNPNIENNTSGFFIPLVYSSAFFIFNTGTQLIKAGWELRKSKK